MLYSFFRFYRVALQYRRNTLLPGRLREIQLDKLHCVPLDSHFRTHEVIRKWVRRWLLLLKYKIYDEVKRTDDKEKFVYWNQWLVFYGGSIVLLKVSVRLKEIERTVGFFTLHGGRLAYRELVDLVSSRLKKSVPVLAFTEPEMSGLVESVDQSRR